MACCGTAHLPDADCCIIECALIRRELTLELHELCIPADCETLLTEAMRAYIAAQLPNKIVLLV